jgi:hypothetical protein
MRHRYRTRPERFIVAVRLALDTPGFAYRKWGGDQWCKRGDWLVENEGDVYTVDAESFARTYRQVAPGRYVKVAPVWAERVDAAGAIRTKEGESRYAPGDYLVFNNEDGSDGYCMSGAQFEASYEPDVTPPGT